MLTLTNARIVDRDHLTTVVISEGTIVALGAEPRGELLDVAGMLVLPGLVEPHLHLDKAYIAASDPDLDGTLERAIAVTSRWKSTFDAEDLLARGRAGLDRAVAHGVTTVRVHPDVDPTVGMMTVEAMLALREEYAGVVDVQIVAFPQEGIVARPGTYELLRVALRAGVDAIGGCSYSERDRATCEEHVRLVLDLAEEHGVPADIHVDFADDDCDPRYAMAEFIADETIRRGLQGRVVVSHLTSLASIEPLRRSAIIGKLAAAEVSVVTLPATDLHLGGRRDARNTRRGITPVAELREAGVLTALSSNNIRNPFTPFGNVDPFETALLLAQTAHASTEADFHNVVEMITRDAARVVGLGGRGVEVGAAADLVVLDAPTAARALLDRTPRRYVLKAGRVVAETRTETVLHRLVRADAVPPLGPASSTAPPELHRPEELFLPSAFPRSETR